MSWWQPSPDQITASVVSSVILTADEFAQQAALDYWDMSAAGHRQVAALLRTALAAWPPAGNTAAASAPVLRAVLEEPARPDLIRRLTEAVAPGVALGCGAGPDGARAAAEQWRPLVGRAVRADAASRLSMHTGARYTSNVPVIAPADLPRPAIRGDTAAAAVVVVIPFRDRSAGQERLRNLLACLAALGDQSLSRSEYRIVVVELDAEPRHAEVIRGRADQYLFLPCPGHFNKAWGVNAGVVQAGNDSQIICVLDGDILVAREFLRRNLGRFGARGHQAHWPFRDALCLDAASTHAAVAKRCVEGEPEVDPDLVRGVNLRQPPGHCVWLRADLFRRIGGMDERFEGWGGEDLDFVFRLNVVAPLDRYDDPLLHMYHPRPQITQDGHRFYAGRQLLSWRPADLVGQLDGPRTSLGDDLAGIIRGPG